MLKDILFALVVGGGGWCLAMFLFAMIMRLISGEPLRNRPKEEKPKKFIVDYDKLSFRLLNIKNHKSLLNKVPYRILFDDMAMCLNAKAENEEDRLITFDEYRKDMWFSADNTAPSLDPPVLESLTESMRKHARNLIFDEMLMVEDNMFVLTNKAHRYGASALFYVGVQKKLYKLFGEYYALPTSVHSWMIIPVLDGNESEREFLKNKVREDNKKLPREEVLSNNLYYFGGKELEVIN